MNLYPINPPTSTTTISMAVEIFLFPMYHFPQSLNRHFMWSVADINPLIVAYSWSGRRDLTIFVGHLTHLCAFLTWSCMCQVDWFGQWPIRECPQVDLTPILIMWEHFVKDRGLVHGTDDWQPHPWGQGVQVTCHQSEARFKYNVC